MTQPPSTNNNSQADNDGSFSHSHSFGEERTQSDTTSTSGQTSNSRGHSTRQQATEQLPEDQHVLESSDRDLAFKAIRPLIEAYRVHYPSGPIPLGAMMGLMYSYVSVRDAMEGISLSEHLGGTSSNPPLPESYDATENPKDPAHSRRKSSQQDQP